MSETDPDKMTRAELRRARRRNSVGPAKLLGIVLATGLLILLGLSLSGRALNIPTWITERAVERINGTLSGASISLGNLAFEVDNTGVPQMLMRDLTIFGADGTEMAQLNDVSARASLGALLRGQIQPTTLHLSGAQMTLRRGHDGQFSLSFGNASEASGSLASVLDKIDAAFEADALASIEKLDADALTITIEDARTGRLWQVSEGRISVTPTPDNLDLSVIFDVFNGTEELAQVMLGITTDRGSSAASIGANFSNAAAADIALQTPALSFLGVLDAPISGAVRADFTTDGTLGSLAGTLEISKGALQPGTNAKPVRFDSGQTYFRFDAARNKLIFSDLSVQTDAASIKADGHAYLRDFKDGWPSTLLGQFALSNIVANPENLFVEPVTFSQGALDFSLGIDPFLITVGQLVLMDDETKISANGTIKAGMEGWEISADVGVDQISRDHLLSLWPKALAAKTRKWIAQNVTSGTLSQIRGAFRLAADSSTRHSVGFHFEDGGLRYLKTLPEISDASGYVNIEGTSLSVTLESGHVVSPKGGDIDISGSGFRILDITQKPATALVSLKGISSTTAVLAILNEPPFQVLRNSKLPVDVAQGTARFAADVSFVMKKPVELPDVNYSARALLTGLRSDKLISGRVLTANELELTATPERVEIKGPARLGNVGATIEWVQQIGADFAGQSQLQGTVELSQAFVDEFGIGLPAGSVSGQSAADFSVTLASGSTPTFKLESDLRGLGLKISPIGWSKSKKSSGNLSVSGTLGGQPNISKLSLSAPDLDVSGGAIKFDPNGSFKSASFAKVKTGGWLDAPITLTTRGKGATPAVTIKGGSVDFRKANFGTSSGGGSGAGGPVSVALDRLTISQGIVLTSFKGDLNTSKGMSGTFSARVNGKTGVTGTLSPGKQGTSVRIRSKNAGGVLAAAGVFDNANGGVLDLNLRPQGKRGVYNGKLKITDTRVLGAPALTELISAISIVGLLDQLGGDGISFSEVDARFQIAPSAITVSRSSATGPSLGISMDGYYDLARDKLRFQGVFSPVYFLNGIGQVFSRRGEGLFGFTFRLRGSPEKPKVKVNPLSILTPGMFREIFRKPAPKLPK